VASIKIQDGGDIFRIWKRKTRNNGKKAAYTFGGEIKRTRSHKNPQSIYRDILIKKERKEKLTGRGDSQKGRKEI
jgi:hypothetical protein